MDGVPIPDTEGCIFFKKIDEVHCQDVMGEEY